ncbi:hypothetical protein PIB30_086609, partial [Stylosanthes scabra]|nr:hypothetical protein [Stylosanthes scabra]
MASQRIGEDTGLSESLPSTHHHAPTYGVFQGINTPQSTLMNEVGAFDFGELQEAIVLQGIKTRNDEEAKASCMILGGCKSGGGEESTDSGVNTNTLSSKLEPEPHHNHFESQDSPISSHHQQHQDQEEQRIAICDGLRKGPLPQQKKKGASSTSEKPVDAKTLRRLAQNREAARKSRLRKKAYVQQLESSRLKLTQLEQDLQRARSQGMLLGCGSAGGTNISSGGLQFDMEYGRWLEDEERHLGEMRRGIEAGISDGELRVTVESYMRHYQELFRVKGEAAKWDVFHIINGTWTSPAERCFLWIGGFRPSEVIGMLIHHLEPLAEQQIMAMYSLRHSSHQAEDALSQGLHQLHHSLLQTISPTPPDPGPPPLALQHMLSAISKLANLEAFLRQADNLRQQSLEQLCRLLTIRQAARCFLVIGDYYARLRALSSLWASRP